MTDDLVQRLRSNRPIPTLPHEAADRIEEMDRHLILSGKMSKALSERIEALEAENKQLREHLISALDTLKDAEVCNDECGPCNDARAALEQSK